MWKSNVPVRVGLGESQTIEFSILTCSGFSLRRFSVRSALRDASLDGFREVVADAATGALCGGLPDAAVRLGARGRYCCCDDNGKLGGKGMRGSDARCAALEPEC